MVERGLNSFVQETMSENPRPELKTLNEYHIFIMTSQVQKDSRSNFTLKVQYIY